MQLPLSQQPSHPVIQDFQIKLSITGTGALRATLILGSESCTHRVDIPVIEIMHVITPPLNMKARLASEVVVRQLGIL